MLSIANNNSLDFDLPSLFRLADALMHAGGFVPSHIRHPGAVVAAVLTGRELGIPPMAALRGISFVEGKPVLDQALHLGIMIARGAEFRWISDGSDGTAQLYLKRPGQEPFISVFTMEMAKKAQLDTKPTWKKYPAAMLRARCVSAASRAYFADALSGCYVPGELEADREERVPNESMEAADLASAGQGAPATVQGAAALPASTEHSKPLDLPEQLVRDFYAIESTEQLHKLIATAAQGWAGFKRDEKIAIKGAREFAEKRVMELEKERAEREKEAAEAEAALSAKVDGALAGEGAPAGGVLEGEAQPYASEPGANDAPDPDPTNGEREDVDPGQQ
jgi:hypothetical protein